MLAPDRVLTMGKIKQTMCANKEPMLNCDFYIGSFKNAIYKMCLQIVLILIYMYKEDLASNNL